jgi:hypothetical protein
MIKGRGLIPGNIFLALAHKLPGPNASCAAASAAAQEQAGGQSDLSGEILTNGDYSPEFRIEAVDNTMYICSSGISAIRSSWYRLAYAQACVPFSAWVGKSRR